MERPDEKTSSKAMQLLRAPVAARRTALSVVPGHTSAVGPAMGDKVRGLHDTDNDGGWENGMTRLLESHMREDCHARPHLQRIGALPWRYGRDKSPQVLLISLRKHDRWTLPKGPPAEGRTAVRSAGLRAFEQAGIVGQICPRTLGGFSYAKPGDDEAAESRHVTLFGLHVKGTLVDWPERKHRKRRWFRLGEAAQIIAESELAGVLETFDPKATEAEASFESATLRR